MRSPYTAFAHVIRPKFYPRHKIRAQYNVRVPDTPADAYIHNKYTHSFEIGDFLHFSKKWERTDRRLSNALNRRTSIGKPEHVLSI